LIEKIKIGLAVSLCVALLIASGLFALERKANSRLKADQEQALFKLRLDHLKADLARGRTEENKILRPKSAAVQGKELEAAKESCQKCFENFEYEVEVKDQDGRWLFRDSNIFDQTPGQLTLTDRFWKELEPGANSAPAPLQKPATAPKRLKNRVLVGFEIDHPKIEYAYSPLGLRTSNLGLGLSIYSSLSFNYSFIPTAATAGIGVEVRF
jgi:hypothetical protein